MDTDLKNNPIPALWKPFKIHKFFIHIDVDEGTLVFYERVSTEPNYGLISPFCSYKSDLDLEILVVLQKKNW